MTAPETARPRCQVARPVVPDSADEDPEVNLGNGGTGGTGGTQPFVQSSGIHLGKKSFSAHELPASMSGMILSIQLSFDEPSPQIPKWMYGRPIYVTAGEHILSTTFWFTFFCILFTTHVLDIHDHLGRPYFSFAHGALRGRLLGRRCRWFLGNCPRNPGPLLQLGSCQWQCVAHHCGRLWRRFGIYLDGLGG